MIEKVVEVVKEAASLVKDIAFDVNANPVM